MFSILYSVQVGNGLLADTPGFNVPSLTNLTVSNLQACFPEIERRLESHRLSFLAMLTFSTFLVLGLPVLFPPLPIMPPVVWYLAAAILHLVHVFVTNPMRWLCCHTPVHVWS